MRKEFLPDLISWWHKNQTQKKRRKVTNAQPSTKLRGSFHVQKPMVGSLSRFFFFRLPVFSARWPPFLDQTEAYGKDGSAPSSAHIFWRICWELPLAWMSFWERKDMGTRQEKKKPLSCVKVELSQTERKNYCTSSPNFFFVWNFTVLPSSFLDIWSQQKKRNI